MGADLPEQAPGLEEERQALKSFWDGGYTVCLQRYVTHWDPKRLFPPLVYRSSCKMEDTCFWSVTNSVNWLVLQTEFDPFGPVTFGKSSRAARLHFLNLSLSHWRAQPDVSHSCAQFMGPTMPTILAVELFWFHAQLSSFTRKEHGFQEREKKFKYWIRHCRQSTLLMYQVKWKACSSSELIVSNGRAA